MSSRMLAAVTLAAISSVLIAAATVLWATSHGRREFAPRPIGWDEADDGWGVGV